MHLYLGQINDDDDDDGKGQNVNTDRVVYIGCVHNQI